MRRVDSRQLAFAFLDAPDPRRPRRRSDCKDGPRPCPWVSCRHHLYLDVSPVNGAVLTYGPGDVGSVLASMPETCALDVADRVAQGEPLGVRAVGRLLGLGEDRVAQIQHSVRRKLRVLEQ